VGVTMQDSIGRAMLVISNHIGEENAISMPQFYSQVYGEPPKSRINGTRRLRELVDHLQRVKKQRICSTTQGAGGYFLARTTEERRQYAGKLRKKAIKELHKAAVIMDHTLIEEAGQLVLDLRTAGGDACATDACATGGEG
jgi:hypothetical protein